MTAQKLPQIRATDTIHDRHERLVLEKQQLEQEIRQLQADIKHMESSGTGNKPNIA
ncbi:hypothetical protein H6F88_18580 [Oculatella sp. FACHB-28]|uniref:hypothetical protein n=1 Tax=Oculatella sp. FACHB-28 TaxID=2692845 RepID=UPI00168787F4|nr:hypothetical protein [Oculatella sp. FACHB-28]MBD2057998.1 hypothetical protein [Oculatella sp. FACHB-28]